MIIWLASYPRSGNTFCRVLLNYAFGLKTYSIYDDKNDIGADERTTKVVGHEFLPEGFSIEEARDAAELYVVKTHGKPTKDMANDKVIYLIRDGRESTVSFQRYLSNFTKKNVSIDDVIIGDVPFDSWGEHVKAWSPKERENTLLIKFEELVGSPVKYIDRISKFVDVNPTGGGIPSFEELKKINSRFFSSGRVDAWKEVLNDEQLRFFEIINFRVLQKFGYSCVLDDSFEKVFDLFEKYQTKIIKEKNVRVEKQLAARNQEYLELEKQLKFRTMEYKKLESSRRVRLINKLIWPIDKIRMLKR